MRWERCHAHEAAPIPRFQDEDDIDPEDDDGDDDAPIDLAQYKAMFEQLARKAKTFWEEHQAEIAVAKTLWSSFKARLAGVGSDSDSDGDVAGEGEPADVAGVPAADAAPDAFTHDGLGGSDSEASSTADSQAAKSWCCAAGVSWAAYSNSVGRTSSSRKDLPSGTTAPWPWR